MNYNELDGSVLLNEEEFEGLKRDARVERIRELYNKSQESLSDVTDEDELTDQKEDRYCNLLCSIMEAKVIGKKYYYEYKLDKLFNSPYIDLEVPEFMSN
jgi:predicted transcriptional regulator